MNLSDFFLGGVASSMATPFTNPIEVIKIRIQLQGELAKRGTYIKPYKGMFHGLYVVAKHDGWSGLQKGLLPHVSFQFVLNAFRLGIYNTAVVNGWTKTSNGNESLWLLMFWGATGGAVGSAVASPFFMIKTHLQSQAVKEIAVGHQHKHLGMVDAFRTIFNQNGIIGLYRGVLGTFPRACLGSGAQLATFGYTKDWLQRNGYAFKSAALNSLLCGALAGSVMAVAITPPDTVLTRLYNQGTHASGKGVLYSGVMDCCLKIVKAEGLLGLYKGFWPTYYRIGPHCMLCLFFFDEMKLARDKFTGDSS